MKVEIARRLEALDAAAEPSLERFDSGPAFNGRTAVLPSAFNPPTLAHLDLLACALAAEGIDRPAAMLTTRNVAKPVFGAPLADRVGMLLALHETRPKLGVLASNSARLVDQAESLRTAYDGAAFDFVVGYDTLVRLFDPGYYKSIFAELEPFFAAHRVIASNRGKAGVSDVERFVKQHAGSFAERIIICAIPERTAGYSSMDARAAIASGTESGMLPPEIEAYVREQGLYRD